MTHLPLPDIIELETARNRLYHVRDEFYPDGTISKSYITDYAGVPPKDRPWRLSHAAQCYSARVRDLPNPFPVDKHGVFDPKYYPIIPRHDAKGNELVLDPHQIETINFTIGRDDSLLWDEAGLGKTISIIACLNWWQSRRVLIVPPAGLKYNWADELVKWSIVPGIDKFIHRIEGKSDTIRSNITKDTPQFLIINYDVLDHWRKYLQSVPWCAIICDEAHRLSNFTAARTQAIFGNPVQGAAFRPELKARKRAFATATPMDRPINIFPVMHSLWHNTPHSVRSNIPSFQYCENWEAYGKFFCAGFQSNFGWNFLGQSNVEALTDILQNFVVRHGAEVLNLPGVDFETVVVRDEDGIAAEGLKTVEQKMMADFLFQFGTGAEAANEGETLEDYKARIMQTMKDRWTDADHRMRIAETFDSLTTIGLNPGTKVSFEYLSEMRKIISQAKASPVAKWLDTVIKTDEPIVYFGVHKEAITALYDHFSKEYRCALITGDVSLKKRNEIVKAFQAGEVDILFANIHAAGEGLTLTRSCHIVVGESDWQHRSTHQAIKRVDRRGQTRRVLTTFVVLDDSLDVHVVRNMLGKRLFAQSAMEAVTT